MYTKFLLLADSPYCFLSTQGCSQAYFPKMLSPATASTGLFDGVVVHSAEFRSRLEDFMSATAPDSQGRPGDVVVVGGGKSAMESVRFPKSPMGI